MDPYCEAIHCFFTQTVVPPCTQNHERETALHCAAQYGHSEVVSILLQELTDPTMRNSRDETPLALAALYGRLQVRMDLSKVSSFYRPMCLCL